MTIILNGGFFELWHDFSHCGAYALVDLVVKVSSCVVLCIIYVS